MSWKNALTSNEVGPTATPATPVSISTPVPAKTAMQVQKKHDRLPGAKGKNERKRKLQMIDAESSLLPYDPDLIVPSVYDEEGSAGLRGSDRRSTMGVGGHIESCTRHAGREAAFEPSTHPIMIDLTCESSNVDPPPIAKKKKRKRRHANQLVEHGSVQSVISYPEGDTECTCYLISRILSPGKSHLPTCTNYLKCGYGDGNLLHDAFGSVSSVKSIMNKKTRESTFKSGRAIPNPTLLSTVVNLHDNDSDADKPASFIMDVNGYRAPSQRKHTSKKSRKAPSPQPASYNIMTIAGDILRAAGIHPTQAPLNNHVCNGYGQNGFCSLGDSCHFLHARLSGS